MKIAGILIFGILLTLNSMCQVTLSRQVISCGSLSLNSGSKHADVSIGEPVTKTVANNTFALTQGFQQPLGITEKIVFTINTTEATCPTSFDAEAMVKNILGCGNNYQISWSTGDTGLVVASLSPGLYSVTVSTEFCETTQEFEVLSGPASLCEIKFFNAFSPNGDGINDTWIIQNIDSPEFSRNSIEIFNRWGQLIWDGKRYDNKDVVWNGDSNTGIELGEGTYYYIAKIGTTDFKGFIELTR